MESNSYRVDRVCVYVCVQLDRGIRNERKMKTRTVLLSVVLVLQFTVLLVPESDAFTKVSYPTAFAILTAAVKFKALWIKAFLGLRQMGYFRHHKGPQAVEGPPLHHYPRYRRSVTPQTFKPEDLMAAWEELEKASGRRLKFDEASCARAGKMGQKQLPMWVKILQSEFMTRISDAEYSTLVSGLIGAMTGDPLACQFTKIITANLVKAAVPVQVEIEPISSEESSKL